MKCLTSLKINSKGSYQITTPNSSQFSSTETAARQQMLPYLEEDFMTAFSLKDAEHILLAQLHRCWTGLGPIRAG